MAARAPDANAPVPDPLGPPQVPALVQGQDDGRGNPPGHDNDDPVPADAVDTFLANTRTDPRFLVIPAQGYHDLSIAYLNFGNLFIKLQLMMTDAYMQWILLRNIIPGTAADIDQFITNGIIALSAATIYMIYTHLGSKTSHHASAYVNRYRNRPPLDKYYELPYHLMRIVEKFGYWQSSEVIGNPGVMLVWDTAQQATFGLANNFQINQAHLNAFTSCLRRLGVTFSKLNLSAPTTSAWFTLLITEAPVGIGFNIFTTFPYSNYQFPFDMYLAFILMGTSSITNAQNGPPIEFIGYRMSRIDSGNLANTLLGVHPDNFNAAEQAQFPVVAAGNDPDQDLHRPLAGYPRTHPSGVNARQTGGTQANPVYTRSALIFGRGGIADTLTINRVAAHITQQDAVNFAQVVLRFGASST